ncbi:MAG TPA: TetR family transcriptional regulator [Thermomonospora sp.]|nr:TetR family transcriptional regulator [Thermomonospora sp.]
MTATETPPVGRRERKKQRTREALIEAAFTLFGEKGFDATTVEEIADAVDVSSRTFFRYFASKEDVALTFQADLHDAVLRSLAERPAHEPVMTALRRAAVGTVLACERGELGFDPSRFRCLMDLVGDSPTVLAGSLEHAQKKQSDLTRAVAARMGVDPGEDLRPHVVAASAVSAFQAAGDVIRCGVLGFGALSEAVDAAFALIEEGLNFPSASGGVSPPR